MSAPGSLDIRGRRIIRVIAQVKEDAFTSKRIGAGARSPITTSLKGSSEQRLDLGCLIATGDKAIAELFSIQIAQFPCIKSFFTHMLASQ